MELIQSVIEELGINLACAGIRSGDEVKIELWTSDGQFIDDTGKGVKVTFSLRRFKAMAAADLYRDDDPPSDSWLETAAVDAPPTESRCSDWGRPRR
ncbi:hypothetical protein [Aurantimonas sp. VKM B-3413]|uniref:hypothetical protein n=1 Tax=Aurantimonas sp. VKM B-3413 TaxID=2779401 RepID=UPI001E58153F|nr:hypothetical protein [Aurantimonas sp. VKM B-3413]MCB8839411.1 hypothetical protein [Aurantimonas sp. VKM B-3413]